MQSKFRLSVSPFLFVLLSAAGAAAVAGVLAIIAIPAPLRAAATLFVAAGFVFAVRRHAFLRGRGAARAIVFLPGGEMEIVAADGGIFRGRLLCASVAPWMTTFIAKCSGRQFHVMAAFDSMPADAHRQLRVRLRSAAPAPTASVFSRKTQAHQTSPADRSCP